MRISATEIQNSFGKYLKLAIDLEDIIITKNGRSVAKLRAYKDTDDYICEGALNYNKKRVTYEEYLELVENTDERYELIDGEIFYLAAPRFKHQVAVNELFGHFYNFFKGKTCRPLTSPFDVHLFNRASCFEEDPNVVQPDIIVMCDEDKVTPEGKYFGIPTLVVEVLSPSTKEKDLLKKMSLFLNSNVREYWIVNTEKENVHVYYFENREMNDDTVYMGDMIVKSVIFEGLEIPISEIFTW